jgi:hypothetical protein
MFTFKAHWTPHYIVSRILQQIDSIINPNAPWFPRSARKWLDKTIDKTMTGIEWGSGRSTLWLSRRVGFLTSIEDNNEWYRYVKANLDSCKIQNVMYQFVTNEWETGPQTPDSYPYVTGPDIKNETLDFAIIDGSYREYCLIRALDFIKPGGLIILDDSNCYLPTDSVVPVKLSSPANRTWERIVELISDWKIQVFYDGVKELKVWQKPIKNNQ